ncbi:hypothetical protein GPECTOR_3g269 [Gonium pectorale]|uniref:tRNA-binding domain-containing protein n=1 Tax=Gonium pectorale TaxID=33097 RepID=A0A150GYY0_GONPE|nr:hypothetical protein GPECTOR_3g269 [Gonium pectorale]|eukprot:KXZ55116.1 hypothetical protein GPECTOR_3g269 [Gonium pectorale]
MLVCWAGGIAASSLPALASSVQWCSWRLSTSSSSPDSSPSPFVHLCEATRQHPATVARVQCDWLRSYHSLLPPMLEDGIRVMIYICSCVGNQRWVDLLDWERSQEWPAVPPTEWTVGGSAAGTVRELGPLSFVRVYQAEQRFQRSTCKAAAQTAEAAPAPEASPAADTAAADPATMDIRVGKIVKCEQHPDADSLYVEQIDVGEPEPRTIVSGLVKFVPLEAMQDRKVIVLCNLKPRNMRGIKSNGMVLCASNDAHDAVEPLAPPAEAPVGERVYFGEDGKGQPAPAEPNRVQKKKMWEAVQPLLKTDGEAVARFKDAPMLTSAGPVRAASLTNATIA